MIPHLLFALFLSDVQEEPDPSTDPAAYLDNALDIIQENALYRDKVDWAVTRKQAHAMIKDATDVEATHPAIQFALNALGDNHSFVMTKDQMKDWRSGPDPEAEQDDGDVLEKPSSKDTEAPETDSEFGIRSRLLEGDIGYVVVPHLGSGNPEVCRDFATEVYESIRTLDEEGVLGWVVDLRGNTGGNCWPMLAGASPILGEGAAGDLPRPTRHCFRHDATEDRMA